MSKSRDIADSAATINFIDGLTSDAQSQIDTATSDISTNTADISTNAAAISTNTADIATKAPLSNPTFTGTVTATAFSGDGSGLTGVDSLPSQTGNAGSFLTTDGTNPSWAEISASPTLEAVASGSLANGDKVIINSDGTVSVVTGTVSINNPPTLSSKYTWANLGEYSSACYDSVTKKIFVFYLDVQSSNYLKGVVGAVESNGFITFGTPYIVRSENTGLSACVYHKADQRVMVFYRRPSNSTSICQTFTVSPSDELLYDGYSGIGGGDFYYPSACYDTSTDRAVLAYQTTGEDLAVKVLNSTNGSISYGSQYVLDANQSEYIYIYFDSTNNKFIIVYQDGPNSDRGTAIVGSSTASNTVTTGTKTNFTTARARFFGGSHDTSSGKSAIYYSDLGSNLGYGTAIVATVSGYTISFGSPVVYYSGYAPSVATAYNPLTNQIVATFANQPDNTLDVIAGSISGTSLSFGTKTSQSQAAGSAPPPNNMTNIFDSANEFVLSQFGQGYGGRGVFSIIDGSLSSNMTDSNYIGISNANYANGATATVQIVGSVDDAQTGLTAGNKYYITKAGALSTTSDTPSVVAGTAVSATKLIVKG